MFRYDYEEVNADEAGKMMLHLKNQLVALPGKQLGRYKVNMSDNFSYTDPIDGSITENQV
jgi:phosphoglucomutase